MPGQKHVCLVTGAHLWRNPRVVKEADALSQAGFRVTVVGPILSQADQERDEALLIGRAWRRVAAPNLLHPTPLSVGRQYSRLRRRLSIIAVRRLNLQLEAALGYSIDSTIRCARAQKADIYGCHLEVGLVALPRLMKLGAPCAIDFEDWYSRDLLPAAQKDRPLRRLEALEGIAIRRAAVAVTTSGALARELATVHQTPEPLVVYNAFSWSDRDRLDGQARDRRDPAAVSLHWFSQTTGPGRGIEPLVDAMDRLTGTFELHIRGDGSLDYRAALLSRVRPETRGRIHFHPTTGPDALLSRIAEHDIGFSLDSPSPASRGLTVTNKVFQYLLGGVAVIATPTPGNVEVAGQAPSAITLSGTEPEELAAAIMRLAQDPEKLRAAKAAALEAAAGPFSWERVSRNLVQAYAHALEAPAVEL
jgi:glycosyltransferase involved in cell wall biosynthesis